MNLAARDKNIDVLRQVLEERKSFLIDKTREIKQVNKENSWMLRVADDYYKYHSIIKKQKMDQAVALELISKYISEISGDVGQSQEILAQSKIQQQELQTQIERLRDDIEKLL